MAEISTWEAFEANYPEINRTLHRLIERGDTQGVAIICSWAAQRGLSLELRKTAINAAGAAYWERRPPIDPPLNKDNPS